MTNAEVIKFFEDCKHHCDNTFFHNMAIKAIKKQIPQKPLCVEERSDNIHMDWICPSCTRAFVYTTRIPNYCPDCGQKISEKGETE